MTIEEKAKAYDEALEKAKEIINDQNASSVWKGWLYNCFPELAESEDERVRKELIKFVKVNIADEERYIAWLEKQGEQKSAWSEEDEDRLKSCLNILQAKDTMGIIIETINTKWLKSLKGRYTWKPSDEQIKICKEVYADILYAKGFDFGTVNSELSRMEEQLKKLKEE